MCILVLRTPSTVHTHINVIHQEVRICNSTLRLLVSCRHKHALDLKASTGYYIWPTFPDRDEFRSWPQVSFSIKSTCTSPLWKQQQQHETDPHPLFVRICFNMFFREKFSYTYRRFCLQFRVLHFHPLTDVTTAYQIYTSISEKNGECNIIKHQLCELMNS